MPRANTLLKNDARLQRFCLMAAFVVPLLWGAIYVGFGNRGVEDEPGQMEAIYHFAEHRPGFPAELPNLPGYHFLVVWLSPGHPTMIKARLITVGLTLLGLMAFAGAWRRIHDTHPGGATLLVALLPVMQPFEAMIYTDVPAMALLFAVFWAQFAEKRGTAAVVLVLACLVRQTCLIWAGYFLVLEAWNLFCPGPGAASGQSGDWRQRFVLWLTRTRWWLLLLGVAALIVLCTGRLTVGTAHGNHVDPNIATVHFGGILLLLLGLPLWIASVAPAMAALRASFHRRPHWAVTGTIATFLAAALLGYYYSNRHVWNRELFWIDFPSTFVLLRNWPLVWIERLPALRWISGALAVIMFLGCFWVAGRQRFRRELWLVLPFGAVLLLTNGLVEPRYFIPPLAIGLLFWEPSSKLLPWQVRWFALLCVIQSPFILYRLALW